MRDHAVVDVAVEMFQPRAMASDGTDVPFDGPSISVRVFGPSDLPGPHLTGRHVIYLDSSVWIELAERAGDARERCIAAVAAGKVLFPLSYAAITELFDQPSPGPRLRVAELMDALSLGVTFRPLQTLHMMEADQTVQSLLTGTPRSFEREPALTWVGEYLGSAMLNFPVHPIWTEEAIAKCVRFYRSQPEMTTTSAWLKRLSLEDIRNRRSPFIQRYVDDLSTIITERSASVAAQKGSARVAKLLRVERLWAINRIVVPRIVQSLVRQGGAENAVVSARAFRSIVGDGNYDRVKLLMQAMPSLSVMCELSAQRMADRTRRVRRQDFFDIEHAQVGLAYADDFVTRDRNLVDLIGRCRELTPPFGRTRYGVEGLMEVLNES